MTRQQLFDLFVKNNTKARDGINPNADYKRKYGDMPFEESFLVYLEGVSYYMDLKAKIEAFERFLLNNHVKRVQSNSSESRYYFYNGIKYRFSSHIYPTGSMTDDIMGVVDFAADPELIEKISIENFKINK